LYYNEPLCWHNERNLSLYEFKSMDLTLLQVYFKGKQKHPFRDNLLEECNWTCNVCTLVSYDGAGYDPLRVSKF